MNQIEILDGRIALLTRRLEALERDLRAIRDTDANRRMASETARDLGMSENVVTDQYALEERRRLARELVNRGWSHSRIAKALGCCERSVPRWLVEC